MAEISVKELIRIIEEHPDYQKKWEKGTRASEGLYIRFGEPEPGVADSEDFTGRDGSMIVVDIDKSESIVGIEIC